MLSVVAPRPAAHPTAESVLRGAVLPGCRGAGDDTPALAGLIRIAVVGAGREFPVAPVGPGRRLAALLRRLPGLRHEEGGGRGSLSH